MPLNLWRQHFAFTFVRNPWDLMGSSYCWWLRKGKGYPAIAHIAEATGRWSKSAPI
jgi:hypothetical protein